MPSKPKHTLDLGFAILELYEDYVIATINEGIVFDVPHIREYKELFEKYYPNRPVGYISNRVNDYTVNPNCYSETKDWNLEIVGVATLCYSEASEQTANFAGQFLDFNHEAFYSMEECLDWINMQLKKRKKADL